VRIDCGSHCEEYGNPPGERPGETFTIDFCDFSSIQQPLGGKKNVTCPPPEKGWALITSPAFVWEMFLGPAVSSVCSTKSVVMAKKMKQGWYNFTFDAKTATGERIYCLTAEVCLRWEDEKKNKPDRKGPWSDCRWPR
jgi:hypothetical protein